MRSYGMGVMVRALALVAAVGVLGTVALVTAESARAAEPSPLAATANPSVGKPGTFVNVVGQGWPAGAHLQLITCGQLGLGGTADCDATVADTTIADPSGAFAADIVLGKPPVPCPCVINVSAPEATRPVDIPVRIVGHPRKPVPAVTTPRTAPVEILSASTRGWGPWQALVGGAAERTAVLKLHNTTDRPIEDVRVRLYRGAAGSPGGDLAVASVGSLQPQQIRTVEVPFTLDPGIGGREDVRVQVTGAAETVVTTTSWAWGLLVLNAALLLLVVWLVARRLRRRRPPAEPGRHAQPRVEQTV